MALTLHILSSGAQADRGNAIKMTGEALTIGRGDTNDLVLPDPTREVSSKHAVLQTHGDDFLVVDTSTNGTFLNAEASPLGDLPSPLNNGDTLRIGPYELRVEIDVVTHDPLDDLPPPMDLAPIMDPAENPQSGDVIGEVASLDHDSGDFLDDLLGAAPPNAMNTPTREMVHDGAGAIDEFLDIAPDANLEGGASAANHSAATRDFFAPNAGENAIPDDWDDDFLSGDVDPFAPAVPEPQPVAAENPLKDVAPEDLPPLPEPVAEEPKAEPEIEVAEEPPAPEPEPEPEPVVAEPEPPKAPEPAPVASAPPSTENANLARVFLTAAGVDGSRIDDDELADIMHRSGTVFRTLIEGSREVLMGRTTIKDELRLEKTTISPDGNNPIKFSINGQQAVEAMVKPSVPGYKAGPASAAEAMADIQAHELAMMSGMENAIKGLLGRFDPQNLAKKLEEDGGKGGFLKGKKARHWEVFEKLYGQISQEAEEDFNSLFGKEFAKAYDAQMKKLKDASKQSDKSREEE